MSVAQLALHSQACVNSGSFFTSGQLLSGIGFQNEDQQWAIRLALPTDIDLSVPITSAVLNLYAGASAGSHGHLIAALYDPVQSLPTNAFDLSNLAGTFAKKAIGSGTPSLPLDYVLTVSEAWVAVDITAMLNEVRTAGYLAGGYVVIFSNHDNVNSGDSFYANGIGQSNQPNVSLSYISTNEPEPEPPDPAVIQDATANSITFGNVYSFVDSPEPIPNTARSFAKRAFLIEEKTPKDNFTTTIKAVNYDDRYYSNDKDYINGIVNINGNKV